MTTTLGRKRLEVAKQRSTQHVISKDTHFPPDPTLAQTPAGPSGHDPAKMRQDKSQDAKCDEVEQGSQDADTMYSPASSIAGDGPNEQDMTEFEEEAETIAMKNANWINWATTTAPRREYNTGAVRTRRRANPFTSRRCTVPRGSRPMLTAWN